MPERPTPAEEVRARRLALGLTLAAFAKRLGVTIRAVQYWESGAREPGGPTLKLIRQLRVRTDRTRED